MVHLLHHAAHRLLGTAMIVVSALAASACGAADGAVTAPPARTSTAPAPAAPGVDVSRFVIQAGDVPLPGFARQSVQPIDEGGVKGVAAVFGTADGTRQMGETIVLLPDAAAARTAAEGAASTSQEQRPGATTSTVSVGDYGVIITGYQLNGTASTLLVFSQGLASVAMDFRSPATDPVPADVVTAVGVRQAALLKSGLG